MWDFASCANANKAASSGSGERLEEPGTRGRDTVTGTADGYDGSGFWVFDAEEARKFTLEMQHGALRGVRIAEVRERAPQEIENLGSGMTGFGRELDEFDEV